ncbi:MAG: antitoxin [Pseudonocardiaceae bacterium]|nr:antitoxin [Pseudonocardiaceae bacterium]
MTRLNVYVPDDLASRARESGLNVSALTQAAIAAELARHTTDAWLASLPTRHRVISHETALDALDAARTELGGARE